MKLLVVDLESPLPDLAPPAAGEQWVLVRVHGDPVGIIRTGRGCTAGELARRVADECTPRILRHVAGDIAGAPASERFSWADSLASPCPRYRDLQLPSISVIVCSRDGADRLPECLASIEDLDYPAGRIERIVVDNAPRDARVRELVTMRHPASRYVVEPRPGLDWARNRGILESRGEIVAFTDDDASVDRGWARAIGRRFGGDPDVGALTGLVVPDEVSVAAEELFERYGGFSRGFERQYFRGRPGQRIARRYGGTGRFGTGANMAFRRTLLDRIGLFDPALDVGTPTNGGGDLEMFFRVLKQGGTLVYDPAAIVRHRHRRSYEALRTQLTNNGIGFYSYLVRSARAYPEERAGFVMLGAWWLWWWNIRRLANSFVRPQAFPRDLILAELRGSFAGLFRYQRSLDRAAEIERRYGPQHSGAGS